MSIRILQGDCRDVLKTLPAESVHCVVTSPPYWGLRDYGVAGQLGMERSLGQYIETMVSVFSEVRRVLRNDGTLWLNLGDSYAAGPNGRSAADTMRAYADVPDKYGHPHPWKNGIAGSDKPFSTIGPIRAGNTLKNGGQSNRDGLADFDAGYLKPKDLCGIPWRVAFALQADGWWLRQDIIWSKPNPMPESVTDRCTKAHEYIFLLSKSARYYYDAQAIKEAVSENTHPWYGPATADKTKARNLAELVKPSAFSNYVPSARNKRSVWEVATAPFSEAHFATFPPALIEPCILAGCPEKCCAKCGAPWEREVERISDGARGISISEGSVKGLEFRGDAGRRGHGTSFSNNPNKRVQNQQTLGFSPSCPCNAGTVPGAVLDPFGGAGTTGLVADRLGRNAVLIELNPEYAAMAERRITDDAPLFAHVAAE